METSGIDPRYINSMYAQKDYSSLQFQLDASQELEDLRAEFLGLEWSDDKQEFVTSEHKMPMMNKIGANAIMSFLRPRVNKIFSLSYQEDEFLDKMCKQYIDDLTIQLVVHKSLYKILSYAITDNIIDLCDDIFRATARKSLQGWEGDGIRKQQSVVETRETIRDERAPKQPQTPFPLTFRRRG